MGFLEKNLAVLKERHPDVARRVEDAHPLPPADTPPAKNGSPTLLAETPDGNRIHLHSSVDPESEAKIFLDAYKIEPLDTVIIFGAGLGYHLAELAGRLSPENNIVVVEKDLSRLRSALASVDLAAFLEHPRISFIFTSGSADISGVLRSDAEQMLSHGGVHLVTHWPSLRTAPDFYHEALDSAKKAVSGGAVMLKTAYALARKSLENRFGNLPDYISSPGIGSLKDRFAGRPGVVVSAGPSLAKNMHLLAELKGRAVIVAVATTFQLLIDHGIIPDFAVIIDYHRLSKQYFENVPPGLGVPLVTDPKASPEAVGAYRGPKLFAEDVLLRFMAGSSMREKGYFEMGATVAHASISFLDFIGCDPIILVGQDLAFTDGLTHLPGTAIFDRWHGETNRFHTFEMKELETIFRIRKNLKKDKDINGKTVYTEDNLVSYRQDFEAMFKRLSKRVLNATGGGLPIAGAEQVTLDEIVRTYRDEPIPEEAFSLDADFASASRELPAVVSQLNGLLKDSSRLGKLYEQALALIRRIRNRLGKDKDVNRLVEELHAVKEKFPRYETLYKILSNIARSDLRYRLMEDRALSTKNLKGRMLQEEQARGDFDYVSALRLAERYFRRELEGAIRTLEKREAR
jgi:hypothetical protein